MTWLLCGCLAPDATDAPQDTTFPSNPGTALTLDLRFVGQIAVTGTSWDGEEHAVFTDLSTGLVACDYAWTVTDYARAPEHEGLPDPFGVPCADPDGRPCDVASTVWLWDGHASSGDCLGLGYDPLVLGTTGPLGYGWSSAWQLGGLDYGPSFATYAAPDGASAGAWAPWPGGLATFDGAVLDYELPFGAVTSTLRVRR